MKNKHQLPTAIELAMLAATSGKTTDEAFKLFVEAIATLERARDEYVDTNSLRADLETPTHSIKQTLDDVDIVEVKTLETLLVWKAPNSEKAQSMLEDLQHFIEGKGKAYNSDRPLFSKEQVECIKRWRTEKKSADASNSAKSSKRKRGKNVKPSKH